MRLTTARFFALAAALMLQAFTLPAFSLTTKNFDNLVVNHLYAGTVNSSTRNCHSFDVGPSTRKIWTVEFDGLTEAHDRVYTATTYNPTFSVEVSDDVTGVLKTAKLDNGKLDVVTSLTTSTIKVCVDSSYQGKTSTSVLLGNSASYRLQLVQSTLSNGELGNYALTGTIYHSTKTPKTYATVATVTAYDQDMNWAGEAQVGANGKYSLFVDPGLYYIHVADGETSFWYPGSPFASATLLDLRNPPVTKDFTTSAIGPWIDTATGVFAQGFEIVINGNKFGTVKGYVDFGGTVTNSATLITAWTDTQIVVTAPPGASPSYVRIFNKATGWSNKFFGTPENLPQLEFYANRTSVREGQAVVFTAELSAPSIYETVVNLSYTGTAKICPQTTGTCDYNAPKMLTIPVGQTSATFSIIPIADGYAETLEKITVTVAKTGRGYVLGPLKSASVNVSN